MRLQSLRARLILIILTPLLVISVAAGAWQFRNAADRAEDIFDRGLLSAAHAISRDMAVAGGDALSPATRSLIRDTSGGEVFYHVYAPDGVFVTGYATPPVAPAGARADAAAPLLYDARYLGRNVRVLRVQDVATIDGLSGVFTITVWQNMEVRNAFARDVAARAFGVIALLVASVAFVVWFGVGIGLRPLLDLEDAIALRSPTELEPIRRPVPIEARGLVTTLNTLLDRVSRRISSKDEFISNAAHQLRNPIAGVLALAEAVQSAPTPAAAKARSAELVQAAREAAHLTNQLLSFERAKGADALRTGASVDFDALVRAVLKRFEAQAADRGVALSYACEGGGARVFCDEVMMQEALLNILSNAAVHGGPTLTRIDVALTMTGGRAALAIADDGVGIDPEDHVSALGRFSQAGAGPGSGLGLPIAMQVMERHHGALRIEPRAAGACITVTVPLEGAVSAPPDARASRPAQ